MVLIKPWTLYAFSLLWKEKIDTYRQKLLLLIQRLQDAEAIPVNPAPSVSPPLTDGPLRNCQFS